MTTIAHLISNAANSLTTYADSSEQIFNNFHRAMALSPHRRKRAQWRRWPRERYAVCVCQNTDDFNIR